jgi:hypothetical protein
MERATMRRWIAFISLFFLVGCSGGAAGSRLHTNPGGSVAPATAGALKLSLSAAPEGGGYRLMLAAPSAQDLYQIAGAVKYDPQRYDLRTVEAGGGLGGPEDCYFVSGETTTGRIAFAYTKKLYGPGASGSVNLLCLRVTPKAGFSLADFSLDLTPGKLLARNSKKQVFAASVEVAP